jgi:hypothetical protein
MAEEPQADVFKMSPAEATAALNKMEQDFRGAPPSATPSTPAEASARLRQLTADPKWRDNFLAGTVAMRQEFAALTELAASGDGTPDLGIETVSSLEDSYALPREGYAALFDGLRANGLPPDAEAYMRDLDAGRTTHRPTAGDGLAAQAALNRLTKDPAFGKRYLDGELEATNVVNVLNRIIAYSANDGKPVTDAVQKRLAEITKHGSL